MAWEAHPWRAGAGGGSKAISWWSVIGIQRSVNALLKYWIQFQERERKCLVSGSCLIIRLGIWSRAKNCGTDNTKRANSEEDRKADVRTRHLLLQTASYLVLPAASRHLLVTVTLPSTLNPGAEELSTPSAAISTCFVLLPGAAPPQPTKEWTANFSDSPSHMLSTTFSWT